MGMQRCSTYRNETKTSVQNGSTTIKRDQNEVCNTTTSRDTSFMERTCQYLTRNKTAQHIAFPTRFSIWVYTKIHSFANNTAALCGARFATDAEVWTAVQKTLQAISAEEFKKTMMQKQEERMQECVINCRKY